MLFGTRPQGNVTKTIQGRDELSMLGRPHPLSPCGVLPKSFGYFSQLHPSDEERETKVQEGLGPVHAPTAGKRKSRDLHPGPELVPQYNTASQREHASGTLPEGALELPCPAQPTPGPRSYTLWLQLLTSQMEQKSCHPAGWGESWTSHKASRTWLQLLTSSFPTGSDLGFNH